MGQCRQFDAEYIVNKLKQSPRKNQHMFREILLLKLHARLVDGGGRGGGFLVCILVFISFIVF